MTAAALDALPANPATTLAVAAGRNLVAAGSIFAAANLFQWGVMSGILHLHPAALSLSWPVAVMAFVLIIRRLRSLGGVPAMRAASWSRWGILAQITTALSLAAASAVTGEWELMRWMSPIGLALYALAYSVAVVRGGPKWLAGAALGCLVAAAAVAQFIGTPEQYLAYACGLITFAIIPGVVLALGRAR